MSDTEQDSIATALQDRVARKRAELGLDTPHAETAGAGLSTAVGVAVVCPCGTSYAANVLRQDGREMTVPSRCEACRTRAEATGAAETIDRKQEQGRRDLGARWAQLAVPPKYREVSLETYEHHGSDEDRRLQMRALTWARRYLAQWPDVADFVVLTGTTGSGKGHVAWSIAKALVEQGASVRNVKLPVLVRNLRDTWGREGGPTYEQVLRGFTGCDLLVVDEVSSHAFYGQQIHQHLYDVIDTRIEACRPTLLTTNEDEAGLAAILRAALFNRLQGEGGFVDFGAASWRSRSQGDT